MAASSIAGSTKLVHSGASARHRRRLRRGRARSRSSAPRWHGSPGRAPTGLGAEIKHVVLHEVAHNSDISDERLVELNRYKRESARSARDDGYAELIPPRHQARAMLKAGEGIVPLARSGVPDPDWAR